MAKRKIKKTRGRPRKDAKYTKKVKKKRIKTMLEMDQVYQVINEVQTTFKKATIVVPDKIMCPIVNNLLKDADLVFQVEDNDTGTVFKIDPPEDISLDDVKLDDLQDELIEDGQLF